MHSRLQPASEVFLAWLRDHDAPATVIANFQAGTLWEDFEDFPLYMFGEGAIMDTDYHPTRIALENGLLLFGVSAACGDPAVIDLRDPAAAVGYLNHETLQEVADVREDSFWPVAFSLDEAADLIAAGKFPTDYHDAVRRDDADST